MAKGHKPKDRKPDKGVKSPFRFDGQDSTAPERDIDYVTVSQEERKSFLQVSFVDDRLKDEFREHCDFLYVSMNERLRHLIRKDLSWHRKRRLKILRDGKKW